jgi:8-oxo-dGTP diphosphatase
MIGPAVENVLEPLLVVGGILLNGDQILIARRAAHKSAAGLWEFPGGKVELGEDPKEALKREILEELNLKVLPLQTFDISETLSGDTPIRLQVIVCSLDGEFQGSSSDHDAFRWAKISDLPLLDWPKPDLPALNALLKLESLGQLWDPSITSSVT